MLHYHKLHGTTNMSIPSLYVILLKMTPISITVTFVKKNEIPSNGSTTVKVVVILLIPNVFLRNTQISKETNIIAICLEVLHLNLIEKTTLNDTK